MGDGVGRPRSGPHAEQGTCRFRFREERRITGIGLQWAPSVPLPHHRAWRTLVRWDAVVEVGRPESALLLRGRIRQQIKRRGLKKKGSSEVEGYSVVGQVISGLEVVVVR